MPRFPIAVVTVTRHQLSVLHPLLGCRRTTSHRTDIPRCTDLRGPMFRFFPTPK